MMLGLLMVLLAGVPEERMESLRQVAPQQRFLKASESFLATQYLNSPLGEGAGVDADPLLRFDAVDCLTLVEQSMAMALTDDANSFQQLMNVIRYSDEHIHWNSRLHIMESQWIPTQESRHLLTNVTTEYGKRNVKVLSKTISAGTWKEKMGVSLHLPVENQTVGTFSLSVIPTAKVAEALTQVPSGTLVVVVRKDRPLTVTMVSHVGIVVQTKSGTKIRHASRTFKKVIDEPIEKYLKRNLDFGTWTVEGVALYAVATELPDGILTRH